MNVCKSERCRTPFQISSLKNNWKVVRGNSSEGPRVVRCKQGFPVKSVEGCDKLEKGGMNPKVRPSEFSIGERGIN